MIITGIVTMIFAILITVVVLLQEGRQANLGAIAGAAETFFDKGRARTLDAFLAKWTKFISIAFFVLMLAGMLITKYVG